MTLQARTAPLDPGPGVAQPISDTHLSASTEGSGVMSLT